MRTIWKFHADRAERFTITMPEGAQILTLGTQGGGMEVWAIVDSDAPGEERRFVTVGTGQRIPEGELDYIGIWQEMGGMFVWHVFEEV